VYSYTIADPLLFYTRVCGNVEQAYTRDIIDEQLKSEFVSALQPAFGALAELELRPAQIPAKANELKKAMNEALQAEWVDRGLAVAKIALNPITLNPEDMKKIQEMEDSATYGSNPFMMAGRMTTATANAMETAAANENGAMMGFMGMNMVQAAGGFNTSQLYQMNQQPATPAPQPTPATTPVGTWICACGSENTGKFCVECGGKKPEKIGWTCACGSVNKGKFCPECGAKKPAAEPQYACDKCGWEPEDPKNPPKFCPECGDRFDSNDIK
jgi:membrane protease subunit (stomatin/prohibitin family)